MNFYVNFTVFRDGFNESIYNSNLFLILIDFDCENCSDL